MTAAPLDRPTRAAPSAPLLVLGSAVALGLAADLLLRVTPWGVNLPLWTFLLLSAGAVIARRMVVPVAPEAPWLALTALLLAMGFAYHDAFGLQALTMLALLGVLGCTAVAARGVSLRRAEPFAWLHGLVAAGCQAAIGLLPLTALEVRWRDHETTGPLRHAPAVAAGLLLGAPLLLVFGALFVEADPVFSNVLGNVIRPDLLVRHAAWVLAGTVLAAGWLRHALLRRADPMPPVSGAMAFVPVATALWMVNGLFLAFVVVQLRYLFGGAGMVEATLDLTYAEYARRGFFELVAASGLVLPVLLGADWAVRAESQARRLAFRRQAGLLLTFVGVIMASALERMRLYVAAFGMSTDRLYATGGEVFLLGLFAWLAVTTLRGRPERFAFGGFLWGLAILGGLHALSPDAFVARWNLRRATTERPFDAKYAAQLSADAAPALFAGLQQLAPADRCIVAAGLARWDNSRAGARSDWRSWNVSRVRAARLAREHETELRHPCAAEATSPRPAESPE